MDEYCDMNEVYEMRKSYLLDKLQREIDILSIKMALSMNLLMSLFNNK